MSNNNIPADGKTPIKPYTAKELCHLYDMPRRSFDRWINHIRKKIGPRIGNYYNLKQVRLIFQEMGDP